MMAVILWLAAHVHTPRAGSLIFAWVHRIVLASIWIIVPIMTCDCLSSEKREGTLGLLFLTNLSSREIVLAKAVAHGLRAFTLWLATVPLIAVPVLLGGLSWLEIAISCALALGSILFALSVGLWASVCSRRLNGAVALAAFLAPPAFLCFAALFMEAGGVIVALGGFLKGPESDWLDEFTGFIGFIWNADDDWNNIMSMRGIQQTILTGAAIVVPAAALVLVATVLLAAGLLRRTWQDKPKTKRQNEVEKFFCAPSFFPNFFRGWMRRSLEKNPIGWLEKRSWTGRITSWIWLAIMISFSTTLAYGTAGSGFDGFGILMWMLLTSIAYVAAGSFRRERETGALELILVTPLSERHIIHGRLRGLWSQFLPTFLLWAAIVVYLSSARGDWRLGEVLRFTVLFLVVPVVGLYFSLRSRFVLLSWTATLAVCFLVPQILGKAFHLVFLVLVSFTDWGFGFRSFRQAESFVTLPV